MDVILVEVTAENREAVLALELGPGQDEFVSTVAQSLAEAAEEPEGKPWYRAVEAGGEFVGFVMLSWDVVPRPPEIIGPWFLWKLIVDHRFQGLGYGREILRLVVDLIRAEGARELLTSYQPGEGGPAGFYARIGFVPTGDEAHGEIVTRLAL